MKCVICSNPKTQETRILFTSGPCVSEKNFKKCIVLIPNGIGPLGVLIFFLEIYLLLTILGLWYALYMTTTVFKIYFLFVCVFMHAMCVQVPTEAREHQFPWRQN